MNERPPLVYRIRQAADSIGVSRSTIYRLIDNGELEKIPLSSHSVGIPVDSVNRWLAKQRAAAAAQS